jgi:hypothetical protein
MMLQGAPQPADPSDVRPNPPTPAQVAVVGYDLWQNHYSGEKDIIGNIVKIEGMPPSEGYPPAFSGHYGAPSSTRIRTP